MVTVIVVLPAVTAVTNPVWLTVATLGVLLVHVTFLFVASLGATVAVNCSVPFGASVSFVLSKVTPVTTTVEFSGFSGVYEPPPLPAFSPIAFAICWSNVSNFSPSATSAFA